MGLAVAIQMDPMETINIDGDTSFVLALEAQARGHALYHYLPTHLSLRDGRLRARGRRLEVRRERGRHHSFGEFQTLDLAAMDVVLMRQDPPFDMAYITATHLLEHVHPTTLVVNDPASVRNAPEKLFVTRFEGLMPPTLITSDRDEILSFRAEHGDIIVKPLFGRIILIEGEPVGAVLRVPAKGEARANLHVSGTAVKTSLTAREREICAAIGPTLRQQGLLFVGIDVIGDYLTEINVTSPTGIQEINRLDGTKLEKLVWDAIEKRLGERGARRPV